MSLSKFIIVEPIYTGGNIYCFLGACSDGTWFLASTADYDVRLLNENPFPASREDIWMPEWQNAHLVKDLEPSEALDFFSGMLRWINSQTACPKGNYTMSDMNNIFADVESLKSIKDWR